MFNKNDPLIGAVQEVMKKNQAERNAAKLVNEKFGVHDRKSLPHEKQGEWDAAYKAMLSEGLHPNQKKLDMNKNKKLDSQDFEMLRAKKKSMEEESEQIDEVSYSAKKARAGKDIGKKGKMFSKIASSAAKRYGSEERGKKVAGAILAKLRAKNMEEETLDERKMTSGEMKKREKIVKSMKPVSDWEKRYPGRGEEVMYATATKQAMKEDNEGFNNRHSLSENASADKKQTVADQLNEKIGMPLAARQEQERLAKNRKMTANRLSKEPKEAPSSIGTRIKQGFGATDAFMRRVGSGMGGDYVAAAGDYAAKNYIGKPLGLSKGTTWEKEYGQEVEKNKRAELNYPTATKWGNVADVASTAAGVGGLVKGGLKAGAKYFVKNKADDVVQSTTKLLSAPKTAKPVSQAVREPTNVAQAAKVAPKQTKSVSQVAREPDEIIPPKRPASQTGSAGIRGTFQDKLAKARQNAGSDLKANQLPTVRRTTEPTNYVRPSVPAVRPVASNAVTRPGTPNLAAGGETRIVGLSPLGKATAAGVAGAAAYGISRGMDNKPSVSQAQPVVKTRPDIPLSDNKPKMAAVPAVSQEKPIASQRTVKKGDTMWDYAKQDIQKSRSLAASGPLAGTSQGSALSQQRVSNKDIAARTERIKALNPKVEPKKMQIGSTIKTS